MKCLELQDIGHLNHAERPTPEAGADGTLLRVLHCALCRTDAKMWKTGHRDLSLPVVLGHEISAEDPTTGKRCVVWPGTACRRCEACATGKENLCKDMRIIGFHRDGGLAEWVVVP